MSSISPVSQPSCGADIPQSVAGFVRPRESLIPAIWETVLVWQARAALRARLAEFEDHRLKDIGVSRAEANREAAKPFWRA